MDAARRTDVGSWEAVIPAIPPSANAQLRMHWAIVRKVSTEWLWMLRLAFREVPKATGPRRVTFIRFGHGLLDEGDNLAASYKFVRDLLRPHKVEQGVCGPKTKTPGKPWSRQQAGIGMVTGDGPGEAEFVYRQSKVSRKIAPHTMVILEDL